MRFEGDGYSKEWAVEAEKRGLYVNRNFYEIYESLEKHLGVFVEVGACSKSEIASKAAVSREEYIKRVNMEFQAFLHLARQQIIPRGFRYLQTLNTSNLKTHVNKFVEDFHELFDKCLKEVEELETYDIDEVEELPRAAKLRRMVTECEGTLNQLVKYLEKDEKFPDLEDFLRL